MLSDNRLKKALLLDDSSLDLFDMLTGKRIEILKTIRRSEPCSIRALAKIVDRNISNVFEDLKLLDSFDLIDFVQDGRKKRPIIKHETIIITFRR